MIMFREQVNTISALFEQWNECEQTVALYSLLKRLSPIKARFLSLALDQSLANCVELQLHEHQANNPGFVSSLLAEGKEVALAQLLLHLPLLRPGNCEAKTRYLSVIHKVLSHSVETGAHTEEAQQLLSYSLIHPAITNEDKRSLTQWVRHLEERITNGSSRAVSQMGGDSPQHQPSSVWAQTRGGIGPDPGGLNGHYLVHNCNSAPSSTTQGNFSYVNGSHARVRRSNSLTPPVSINQTSELWSSQDDLTGRQKPRSFSLSSEHAPPLSPQSSLASSGSGSESHLDELRLGFTSDACGMRDVPTWLKSLRLHKYAWLFAQLNYEEMLGLTEERLAAHGVTKGARHKIVISIRRLRERYSTLCQLEKDVVNGGNLCSALEELKAIIISPIKASKAVASDSKEREETEHCDKNNGTEEDGEHSDENVPEDTNSLNPDDNIPAQFTKVMGKVCTQLLVSSHTEEESVRLFMSLLDHSLQHDAFTTQQKRRLSSWKLQMQDAWHLLPSQHKGDHRHVRNKWTHHSHFTSTNHNGYPHSHTHIPHSGSGIRMHRFPVPPPPTSQLSTYQQQQQQRNTTNKTGFNSAYPSLTTVGQQHRNSLSVIGVGASFMAKRPSLQDTSPEPLNSHTTLQRTKSAPPKPNHFCGLSFSNKVTPPEINSGIADPEINSRLESLCLSMTEHALSGGSEV